MVLADADLNGLNLSSTLLGPVLAQAWCWAQSWETLTLPSQGSWELPAHRGHELSRDKEKTVMFSTHVCMDGCESWTIKKDEHRRIHAFELWCWRRLLRVPWTARRLHQSILKEINPEYSLAGLMLKLKLQYFSKI